MGATPAPQCHVQVHLKVQIKDHFQPEPRSGRWSREPGQVRVCLTSGAGCAQGGPVRGDGLCARTTESAPAARVCSNDFSSCICQSFLPAPVTGFASGRRCGSGTCVASGGGTCSPWACEGPAPRSSCRGRCGAPAGAASHCGSGSGSETWTRRTWSRCHFSSSSGTWTGRGTASSSAAGSGSGSGSGSRAPWASRSPGCRPWLSSSPRLSSWCP